MGSADLSAASALLRSPDLIASSTLRTSDFTRVRRPLLTSVRLIIWRAAFFADDVLAMKRSLYCLKMPLAHLKGEPRPLVEVKPFRAGRSVQAGFAGGRAVRRRSVNEATANKMAILRLPRLEKCHRDCSESHEHAARPFRPCPRQRRT